MILLLVQASLHHCDYDNPKMHDYLNVPYPKEYKQPKKNLKADTWEPIRIQFDYDNLYKYGCNYANIGQIPKGWQYACRREDVFNQTKVNILKDTLENVKSHLNKLLKVRPTSQISLYCTDQYPCTNGKIVTGVDLYFTVYARSFDGSSTLASAGSYFMKNPQYSNRPTQGFINVNFAMSTFDKGVSSIDSFYEDRYAFEVYFHEVCHALGITGSHFLNWENPNDPTKPYLTSLPLTSCQSRLDSKKKHSILATPKLKEYIKQKFGVGDYLQTGCPTGAEIEDGGGQGTGGSHFEMRTNYGEIMVGMAAGPQAISNLTLNALADSGWYQVNFSMAEPHFWGDYKARIGDTPYTTFPLGSPVKDYPEGYVGKLDTIGDTVACGYDHRFYGFYRVSKRASYLTGPNEYPGFYDPYSTGNYGSLGAFNELTDYAPFITQYSNTFCQQKTQRKDRVAGLIGPNSYCSPVDGGAICTKMTCDRYDNLTVYNPDDLTQSMVCKKKGEKIGFLYGSCPDPKVVCGVINYDLRNNKPPIPKPTPAATIRPIPPNPTPAATIRPIPPNPTPAATMRPIPPNPTPAATIRPIPPEPTGTKRCFCIESQLSTIYSSCIEGCKIKGISDLGNIISEIPLSTKYIEIHSLVKELSLPMVYEEINIVLTSSTTSLNLNKNQVKVVKYDGDMITINNMINVKSSLGFPPIQSQIWSPASPDEIPILEFEFTKPNENVYYPLLQIMEITSKWNRINVKISSDSFSTSNIIKTSFQAKSSLSASIVFVDITQSQYQTFTPNNLFKPSYLTLKSPEDYNLLMCVSNPIDNCLKHDEHPPWLYIKQTTISFPRVDNCIIEYYSSNVKIDLSQLLNDAKFIFIQQELSQTEVQLDNLGKIETSPTLLAFFNSNNKRLQFDGGSFIINQYSDLDFNTPKFNYNLIRCDINIKDFNLVFRGTNPLTSFGSSDKLFNIFGDGDIKIDSSLSQNCYNFKSFFKLDSLTRWEDDPLKGIIIGSPSKLSSLRISSLDSSLLGQNTLIYDASLFDFNTYYPNGNRINIFYYVFPETFERQVILNTIEFKSDSINLKKINSNLQSQNMKYDDIQTNRNININENKNKNLKRDLPIAGGIIFKNAQKIQFYEKHILVSPYTINHDIKIFDYFETSGTSTFEVEDSLEVIIHEIPQETTIINIYGRSRVEGKDACLKFGEIKPNGPKIALFGRITIYTGNNKKEDIETIIDTTGTTNAEVIEGLMPEPTTTPKPKFSPTLIIIGVIAAVVIIIIIIIVIVYMRKKRYRKDTSGTLDLTVGI